MIRTLIIVALSVSGHVVAVYLAHLVALTMFGERRKALCSQLPMLALMVLYTISSLWILSEPIIVEEEVAPTKNAQPDQTLREPPMPDAP
jgi:Gpi18-like mannosyltransferase